VREKLAAMLALIANSTYGSTSVGFHPTQPPVAIQSGGACGCVRQNAGGTTSYAFHLPAKVAPGHGKGAGVFFLCEVKSVMLKEQCLIRYMKTKKFAMYSQHLELALVQKKTQRL
jgi:hypothetical protein